MSLLFTVEELRHQLENDRPALIAELTSLTRRGGHRERVSWENSLPKLLEALTHPSLSKFDVHFARREHHVALEYQLPGTGSWCDVVLLGRHGKNPSVIVIELKDWDTLEDFPGITEGLIGHRGSQWLHPSDQLKGYVEYCRHFHETVLNTGASVHGLVLFTRSLNKHSYVIAPNERLTADYPIFTMSEEDIARALPNFIASRLSEPDTDFAYAFVSGAFRQDRGFTAQVGGMLLRGDTKHFELLDSQRRAFHYCRRKAREIVNESVEKRKVVIVYGPPGSGKSAVAARVWASLVTDPAVADGNIVLVTTSQSQNSNWVYLLDATSSSRSGRGIARKATSFHPLDSIGLNRLRKQENNPRLYQKAANWREHLKHLDDRKIKARHGAESNSILVALVDEAHALINPEREHGTGSFGFCTGLGPQAYHIIRCSRLTVFFMDTRQRFRARENTKVSDIKKWAREFGASVQTISLGSAQFRCAGSAEYVTWLESLLKRSTAETNRFLAQAWHDNPLPGSHQDAPKQDGNVLAFRTRATQQLAEQSASFQKVAEKPLLPYGAPHLQRARRRMDFRVFADPFEMEKELTELSAHYKVRLVSSFSRAWKTKKALSPHKMEKEGQDFCELVVTSTGERRFWHRPWNYVPDGDFTGFVLGRDRFLISQNPLCEVGCTYVVRGFDFDYIGLLWLDDLIWRNGGWQVPLANMHESGNSLLKRRALREGPIAPNGPYGRTLLAKVRQSYRILLTRAIHGVYVWIPDDETRQHVSDSLS